MTPDQPHIPPSDPEGMADLRRFEIQEVRYSLPEMLRELHLERTHSFFAKEIIDQVEINKIFAEARARRAKAK